MDLGCVDLFVLRTLINVLLFHLIYAVTPVNIEVELANSCMAARPAV